MKTIKNASLFLTVLFVLITATGPSVLSQPVVKHKVRNYLNRTVLILHSAKQQLETGKNYTGDFARATAHQKYARKLFLAGEFKKAVHHSHRARVLAFAVIKSNKGEVAKEFNTLKEEEELQSDQPKDEELDRSLQISEPNIKFDDRAAVQAPEAKSIEEK